jgi:hypothetical protein
MILWHLAYDEQPYYIPPKVYVTRSERDFIARCRIRQGALVSSEVKLITVSFNRVLVNAQGFGEHAIERVVDAQTGNVMFDWRVTDLFDRIVQNWSELKAALTRNVEGCNTLPENKHNVTPYKDEEREEARTHNSQDDSHHDTMQVRSKFVSWDETTNAAEKSADVQDGVDDKGTAKGSDDVVVDALTDGRREKMSEEDSRGSTEHHDGDEQEHDIETSTDVNQVPIPADSESPRQDDSGLQVSGDIRSEKTEETKHLSVQTGSNGDTGDESEPGKDSKSLGLHGAMKKTVNHTAHVAEPMSMRRKSPALTPITRERFWDIVRDCDSLKTMSDT